MVDKFERVAMGFRSYILDGAIHDSIVSDQLVSGNGVVDAGGKVTSVPLESTTEPASSAVVRIDIEDEDEDELVTAVDSGRDWT
jgi:hypothetical protein